jgi:hypothetical protein
MSSLDDGFIRQTTAYALNDYFPLTSFVPQRHGQFALPDFMTDDATLIRFNQVKILFSVGHPPKGLLEKRDQRYSSSPSSSKLEMRFISNLSLIVVTPMRPLKY